MQRIALAATLAFAISTIGAVAMAQATVTTFVFATVDSVDLDGNQFQVTGILQGEAAPTTRTFLIPIPGDGSGVSRTQSCERKALLVMSKPGQYLLEIRQPVYYSLGCRLTRVTP